MRALGIDPGTKSFDLVVIESEEVVEEVSIETSEVAKDPSVLVKAVKSLGEVDLIAGPSGYGTPLVFSHEISDPWRFALEVLLLTTEDDIRRGMEADDPGIAVYKALADVVKAFWEYGLRVCYIPSVKLLPTVPTYRKVNKLDMGTADKLAVAALAIHDQAVRLSIDYEEVSFILVEMGYGYNAVIGVDEGKVVDGLGGTLVPMGFLTIGPVDAELVVAGREWVRTDVFHGGVADACRTYSIDEMLEKAKESGPCSEAFRAMIDSVVKAVKAMTASVRKPKEVILSGRLMRYNEIREAITEALSDVAPVARIRGLRGAERSKEAAQGYALIAEGIAGGHFKNLVERLGILEARGTLADHIYHPRLKPLRERLVRAYRTYLRPEAIQRIL